MAIAREVIVYSTALCAPCEALKRYLRSRGVAFTVKDPMMDEDVALFLEDRQIHTTPVLEVDGEILAGNHLRTERIDALLGL